VRSISCPRPISFSTDFAAVIDSLLLLKCRSKLEGFWGPCQSGGVHDSLASVAVLILLSQSRFVAGLPLLLLFADQTSAFDAANRSDMLWAAFIAGVAGQYWLLLDDLLACDHSRIRLRGFLSAEFCLPSGTAQ
jgi:hypothetical protein